ATYTSARRIELETITLARVALAAPVHQPMLASGGTIPTRGDYAYEVSWDGFRAIVSRPRDRSASAADGARPSSSPGSRANIAGLRRSVGTPRLRGPPRRTPRPELRAAWERRRRRVRRRRR